MIEGDIKGYLDNINYRILEEIIKEDIKDQGLIEMYWKLVKAGYVRDDRKEPNTKREYKEKQGEDREEEYNVTGVPKGGIMSTLLSNIYLHKLDVFMGQICEEQSKKEQKGEKESQKNKKLFRETKKEKRRGDKENKREAQEARSRVSRETRIGNGVNYVRYADNWVVGIKGTRRVAMEVKERISKFLNEKLELEREEEKTKITNIRKDKARFLGVEISRQKRKYTERLRRKGDRQGRQANDRVIMNAPIREIEEKLKEQKFTKEKGFPKAQTKWIYKRPKEIIRKYKAMIKGILNYYSFVNNRNKLRRIYWILRFSAVFTLARKWNISARKVIKKLKEDS